MNDVAVFANAPQVTADALAVVLSGRLAWRVKTLSVERGKYREVLDNEVCV
jgi:hypothetical protein